VQSTIDAAVGSTLMNKMEDEVYNMIEEMTLKNYQRSKKHGQPRGLEVNLKLMHLLYLLQK